MTILVTLQQEVEYDEEDYLSIMQEGSERLICSHPFKDPFSHHKYCHPVDLKIGDLLFSGMGLYSKVVKIE